MLCCCRSRGATLREFLNALRFPSRTLGFGRLSAEAFVGSLAF